MRVPLAYCRRKLAKVEWRIHHGQPEDLKPRSGV
jgi:hypothetical protein